MYELKSLVRKSFYGKAMYETLDNGNIVLRSYNTPVLELNKEGTEVKRLWGSYSLTTNRHIKDFISQFAIKGMVKSFKDLPLNQWEKL